MTEADRNYYIEWLLVRYQNKSRSYFESMTDRELIEEYERALSL